MKDPKELPGRISGSELEVMELLWDEGCPLPMSRIRTALAKKKGWEPTTIKTLVGRLVAKEALSQEKRQVFYYSPNITREQYKAWATGDLVDRLYRGSAKSLVAALVSARSLSREDIAQLRALLEEAEDP